jgi:hypothetical protein
MATPLKALADYIYVRRKDWAGLDSAISSLRIESDELEKVTCNTLEALLANCTNSRVRRFLKALGKDLKL